MAKEFDVFLNDRKTECDIIVYSIPYRDGLTVMDKLALQACLESLLLQKFIAVHTNSSLTSNIDRLISTCAFRLQHTALIHSELTATHTAVNTTVQSGMVISDDVKDLLYRIEYEAESALNISTQLLELGSNLTFGKATAAIHLHDEILETLTTELLSIKHRSQVLCDAVCTALVAIPTPPATVGIGIEVDMVLQRYRRLSDMDDKVLSDFDDMTLVGIDRVTV